MACKHPWAGEYPNVYCPDCGVSWTSWAYDEMADLRAQLAAAQEREKAMRSLAAAVSEWRADNASCVAPDVANGRLRRAHEAYLASADAPAAFQIVADPSMPRDEFELRSCAQAVRVKIGKADP